MDTPSSQNLNIRLSTRGKRPLRNLTPNDKIRAIQRIHNGETKASVSRDINVPESTLRGWCKNEQKLRFMCRQIRSNYELENSQPTEKRNKFDTINPLTMATKFRDSLPHLERLDFIINGNGNQAEPIFEEMSDTEYTKKNALPILETEITQFTGTANRENSSAHIVGYHLDNPTDNKSSSVQQKNAVLQYQPNYSPESDKNVSGYRSGREMEVNGYNLLNINCIGDLKNNNFTKQMRSTGIENCNNICIEDNNIHRTSELTLLQWYTIFNTSLSCLALIATAATLQSSDICINPVKNESTKSSTRAFGAKTAVQNDMSSDFYYESEPEDLSIRSTISTASTSTHSRSQSPAQSIISNSSQSDADS